MTRRVRSPAAAPAWGASPTPQEPGAARSAHSLSTQGLPCLQPTLLSPRQDRSSRRQASHKREGWRRGRAGGQGPVQPASRRRTLTIHLGGWRRVVLVGAPPVRPQTAALPAGALQHVHDLTAVDVPQGRVQPLHCGEKKRGVLAGEFHGSGRRATSRGRAGRTTGGGGLIFSECGDTRCQNQNTASSENSCYPSIDLFQILTEVNPKAWGNCFP